MQKPGILFAGCQGGGLLGQHRSCLGCGIMDASMCTWARWIIDTNSKLWTSEPAELLTEMYLQRAQLAQRVTQLVTAADHEEVSESVQAPAFPRIQLPPSFVVLQYPSRGWESEACRSDVVASWSRRCVGVVLMSRAWYMPLWWHG